MPNISLTTFIDFVVAPGTTRITRVREAKEQYQRGYNPAFDFYRGLRNGIAQYHRAREPLAGILRDLTDEKKRLLYGAGVRGYRRWIGRRECDWVQPDPAVWVAGQLEVRVNPELGLIMRDQEYRVKLYFKADRLSKPRVDTMLRLMQITLPRGAEAMRPGILDVQRGRLIEPTAEVPDIDALLVAEATAFVSMWDALRI